MNCCLVAGLIISSYNELGRTFVEHHDKVPAFISYPTYITTDLIYNRNMENVNQSTIPGETSKSDRIISTVESLMNGENNQKIIENLKMYHDAGRGKRASIFHENIEDSKKNNGYD